MAQEKIGSQDDEAELEVVDELGVSGDAAGVPVGGFDAIEIVEDAPLSAELAAPAILATAAAEPVVPTVVAASVSEAPASANDESVSFLEVEEVEAIDPGEHQALRERTEALQAREATLIEENENQKGEILRLQDELRVTQQRFLRVAADFENFKRRTERDREDTRKQLIERLLLDIVPVNDNLERALSHVQSSEDRESLVQGVEMVQRQLVSVLGRHGCAPFDSVGRPFDPQRHEAIQQIESSTHDFNTIIEEYQKGYLLYERLLRPALVVVSRGAPQAENVIPVDDTPIAVDSSGEARPVEGEPAEPSPEQS